MLASLLWRLMPLRHLLRVLVTRSGPRAGILRVSLPQVAAPTAPTMAAEPLDTRMGYESPNRFVYSVTKQGSGEEAIHLVLRRDGLLAWKLAELRLP